MAGLDNKISNVIATQLPTWLIRQLNTRASKNAVQQRDNDNLKYVANKTGWIRVVSSINISNETVECQDPNITGSFNGDLRYFKDLTGLNLTDNTELAKNYILYGGTSKYNNKNSGFDYQLRSGIGQDGAYGMLGTSEVQQYGYRPMPGITDATIETMGRLGSIRLATINFKVWDKAQLDVIDALYFKLGYSILIEWGNTTYYKGGDITQVRANDSDLKVYDTELLCIDPFKNEITKEQINSQIYQNMRESEGNYEAMLGIISNYNFSLNQEGGYDCSIKVVGLGALGDSIKANQTNELPDLVIKEVKKYVNNLKRIQEEKERAEAAEINKENDAAILKREQDLKVTRSIANLLGLDPKSIDYNSIKKNIEFNQDIANNDSYLPANKSSKDTLLDNGDIITKFVEKSPNVFIIRKQGLALPLDRTDLINSFVNKIVLDKDIIKNIFSPYIDLKSKETSGFLSGSIKFKQPGVGVSVVDQGLGVINLSYSNSDINLNTPLIQLTPQGTKINYNKSYYAKLSFVPLQNPTQDGSDPLYNSLGWVYNYLTNNDIEISSKDIKSISLIDLPSGDQDQNAPEYIKSEIPSSIIKSVVSTKNNRVVKIQVHGIAKANIITQGKDNILEGAFGTKTESGKSGSKEVNIPFIFTFYETSIIKKIDVNEQQAADRDFLFKEYFAKQVAQSNPSTTPKPETKVDQVNENQIRQALAYQSSLELILKAIQLYSINNTLLKGVNYTGKTVYPVKLMDKKNTEFYNSIMSLGVFSPFKDELFNNKKVNLNNYPNNSRLENLKIQAKYGFNSSIMLMDVQKGLQDFNSIKPVDFESLMTSYVIPYNISQNIVAGTSIDHPVYVTFGFLLMMLNNMCVLYDTKTGGTEQVPLVYIDFHPETNYCLSAPEQLSIDVKNFLIPFQGTFNSYKNLFDSRVLTADGKEIIHPSGSTNNIPLFNAQKQDGISGNIPPFKFSTKSSTDYEVITAQDGTTGFRGKIMNVLINIEYILNTIQSFTSQNGSNDVYIKPFIEKILSDMNKSFGDFNVFRLAYNDASNTFMVIDDQYTPGVPGEQIQRSEEENRTEIPVYGLYSIAKNLELRSEVSSKLSSMIAISSNSDAKYAMSTDATSFGFINTNFVDRYVNNKTEIAANNANKKVESTDSLKNSAIMFNETITEYYGTTDPKDDSLGHATNYYIEKMSRVKAQGPTRSSVLIPLSLNFTTDGISGFRIGNAFTVSDKFLPYTYNQRTITSPVKQKVGFCVVGVTHNIQENVWNTSIRSHMIYLKDTTDFKGELNQQFDAKEVVGSTSFEETISYNITENIRLAIKFFIGIGYNKFATAALVGGFLQESQMNPTLINSIGAYGIAQWLDRKDNLIAYAKSNNKDYTALQTQLDFVVYELNSTEADSGSDLKNAISLEQAIQAAANYERFKGYNQGFGVGPEWGNRIGYARQILKDIESGLYGT